MKQPIIIALHYHNQETSGEPIVSEQRHRDAEKAGAAVTQRMTRRCGERWWATDGALKERKSRRERWRKRQAEGWMEGSAMKGSCSTCDGWASAQVWRHDQIKSLSRQQWTRDKVITFAPSSSPFPSPSTTLSLSLSALSSLYCRQLSAARLSVCGESRPSLLSVARHVSIMSSGNLLYAITYFHSVAWWIWLSIRNILKYNKKKCYSVKVYYRVQNMFTPFFGIHFHWLGSNIPIMGK